MEGREFGSSLFCFHFVCLIVRRVLQIERVTAVCNNTIVIIQSGGSVYMPGSTHPNNVCNLSIVRVLHVHQPLSAE